MLRLGVFITLCLWLAGAAPLFAEPQKVAYFGVLIIDSTGVGISAEEEARRAAMEARLREAMADSGRYSFVDISPVADKAQLYSNLSHCNGCDSQFAADLGADLALSAEVQKTSNLILSTSVYIRDTSGTLVGGGSADMRGNTDETWARAINYILKNRILK